MSNNYYPKLVRFGLTLNSALSFLMLILSINSARASMVRSKFLLKGTSGIAHKSVSFSYVDYWAFLPQVFDSVQTDKNGRFSKVLQVECDRPFYVFIGRKNIGMIFPQSKETNIDSLGIILDFADESFTVQGKERSYYKMFYHFYSVYRINGGFDSKYTSLLRLTSRMFCDSISRDFKIKNTVIDSFLFFQAPFSMVNFLRKTVYYELISKMSDYQEKHLYYLTGKWSFFMQDTNISVILKNKGIYEEDLWVPDCSFSIKHQMEAVLDSIRVVDTVLRKRQQLLLKFDLAGWRYSGLLQDLARLLIIKELADAARSERHYYVADSLTAAFKVTSKSLKYYNFIFNYCITKNPFHSILDFELPSSAGFLWKLSSDPTPVKVILFWASWCSPCKKVIPEFVAIKEKFQKNSGVNFISVALESKSYEEWTKNEILINFADVNLYASGQFSNPEIREFNLISVPRIVVLRNGRIESFNLDINMLSEILNKIL